MANLGKPEADAVLVACPSCKAWPMAVNICEAGYPGQGCSLSARSAVFRQTQKTADDRDTRTKPFGPSRVAAANAP